MGALENANILESKVKIPQNARAWFHEHIF